MATTDSIASKFSEMSTKRKAGYGLIALLAIMLLIFILNLDFIKGMSRVGAGYGAHIACSCRYIEGRDLQSCEGDMESGMEIVSLSDDPENKRVTASVPFFSSDVAEYREGFGCIVLNEDEREALD